MKKIYLFCSAGMSTSMLASKMQSVADQHNIPVKVAAFPHNKIGDIIASDRPDCILLGPQVKYMYEETVSKYGHENIPIEVMPTKYDVKYLRTKRDRMGHDLHL